MLKTCFRLLVLGVTVVIGANSAVAQNFHFAQGELQRLPDVAANSSVQDGWIFRGQTCGTMAGCDDAGTCAGAAHCGDCDDCCDSCCDDCVGNWRDNTVVFLASDAWSNIGDAVTAANAFGSVRTQSNFGYRTGFNMGLGILGDRPIRAQIGTSYGAYDFKGRSNFPTAIDSAVEQQIFFTAGLYKRSDICCGDRISWGIVYDHMYDDRWGAFTNQNVNVGQIRGIFGYALNECNEVGVWGATRAQNDNVVLIFPPTLSTIRSVDQVNAFWHHNYAFGGDTWLYVGGSDSPSSWQIGFSGQAPLSNRLSLFGSSNYYIPGSATGSAGSTEEIWNVTVGISLYLGGKAVNRTVSGNRGLPLLNVADNGTLAIQR